MTTGAARRTADDLISAGSSVALVAFAHVVLEDDP